MIPELLSGLRLMKGFQLMDAEKLGRASDQFFSLVSLSLTLEGKVAGHSQAWRCRQDESWVSYHLVGDLPFLLPGRDPTAQWL